MADDSPPGSPLSLLSSDAFEAEEEHERLATMPPAKRQKLGNSLRGTPIPLQDDADDNGGDISSDTDGDIPTPPSHLKVDDDEVHEQITKCNWEGCQLQLSDTDELVTHISNEHIENKSKVYTCEWMNCARKGKTHASGYALKSHMRSHTREKPFFCLLPECDRSFTRSDALAKHMRTVHDTEPLRPSDPIPKANIKHRHKASGKDSPSPTDELEQSNGVSNGDAAVWTSSFPSELGFTAEEEARGLEQLYQLLRRQVHWAEEEGVLLKQQCDAMEEIRKQEWLEKEVLLDQVINTVGSYNANREQNNAIRATGPDGLIILPKTPKYAIPKIQAAAEKARTDPKIHGDPNIARRRWFRNHPEATGLQLPAIFRTAMFFDSLRGMDGGKHAIHVLNSLPVEDRMDFLQFNVDTGAAGHRGESVALVLAMMNREWQSWTGS